MQVVTGARTTKLATEKGSSGVRAVGVEYAVGGPGSSRQTGVRSRCRCCVGSGVRVRDAYCCHAACGCKYLFAVVCSCLLAQIASTAGV
jgi:hypothetical protein